jgi:FdhD protein
MNQISISSDIYRIVDGSKSSVLEKQVVVAEQSVAVIVDSVGSYTILCTPGDLKALAVGFVYAEGLIDSIDEVLDINIKDNTVGIVIENPHGVKNKRNLIVTSSCGFCGVRNIEARINDMPVVANKLTISASQVLAIANKLRAEQKIYQQSGGIHAAGIFDEQGEIIAVAEDVGRHSALDKVIGKVLLSGKTCHSLGVVLSSRISFEMITKAARAGVEIMIAASSPTSLAIKAAEKWHVTLCGYARANKANIYTYHSRIESS